MKKYKVGVIQINSQANVEENLKTIVRMIEEAVENGAKLISLPEVMNQTSSSKEESVWEEIPGRTINLMLETAKKYGVWIHCGSIKEMDNDEKHFNTSVMVDPNGKILGSYRKLHLFDVDLKDGGRVRESDRSSKGYEIVNIQTEIGNLGFTICYDLRFPELFRILALNGAEIIFVPANFTYQTGKAHWASLLRARAIENGCYIIAAAQIGQKMKFKAYGHSMIINPWGTVLAEAPDEATIIYADIDLDYVHEIRGQIPSLLNRRADVYSLTINNKDNNI